MLDKFQNRGELIRNLLNNNSEYNIIGGCKLISKILDEEMTKAGIKFAPAIKEHKDAPDPDQLNYSVLYRFKKDLILFDFTSDKKVEDIDDLIKFHFEERHELEERIQFAVSIFKDFYLCEGESELIHFEIKK